MNNNNLTNLKFLSINDLAKIFNISRTTAYRIIGSRKIPFYKISGVIRFAEKDIIKYLEDNRINPIK